MKLFICLFLIIGSSVSPQPRTNKIVMIVSSYGKDMGKTRPGFEMDEFSQAYLIFKLNGLQIDVASPKGGKAESGQFNKQKPYNKIIMEDQAAMNLLEQTKPTSSLLPDDYDAVYVVGGKGPMFDLVVDPSLQDFVLAMNKKKSVISAVCHGTIAFANIKDAGAFIIENKQLTGFCNDEEKMFGKSTSEFPFLLEDRLIQRGAKYQKGDAMLPFMIKDDNFVTGQNPYSTTLVAEQIVRSLGKVPVQRKKYKDEQSMDLVKQAASGQMAWASAQLAKDKDSYDLELIAVYGYYLAKNGGDDAEKMRKGTSIAELVLPYYFNEDLYINLADFYLKQGEKKKAIKSLNDVISRNPNSEPAKKLLTKAES